MKNFKELDALVDSILTIRLKKPDFGNEHILYMNVEQKKETDLFLKSISQNAISSSFIPFTSINVESFIYRNENFYIVETGYSE